MVQAAALAALAFACARGAGAQTVRGTVLLPDSSRAAGVIVVANDDHGAVAARALTGERGDFELHLPGAGRYALRVLRIGFQPTEIAPFDIADGEGRTVSIVLRGEAVVLSRVTVRGRNDCQANVDAGQQVAAMWQEARKAITATQLSPGGARQTVEWTTYNRSTDMSGDLVIAADSDHAMASAMKAFVSLPPDSLAQVGYMTEDATGTIFRAPDAEALLSDAFASAHCFHVEAPTSDHADWVGIGFRPVRDRHNIVDIAGTLWLDRASSELRLLEFHYTNLPPDYEHVQAGGQVEFLRLSTGSWLVGRWQLRMPRTALTIVGNFNARVSGTGAADFSGSQKDLKSVVQGLQFTGGEVTAVRRGSEVLFSTGHSSHDYSPALLAADAKLAQLCGADSANGDLLALLRGTVIDNAHAPVPGAAVRITWRGQFHAAGSGENTMITYRDEQRDLAANRSGEWYVCGVPRERIVTVRATIAGQASAPVTVRIPREKVVAGVDVEIPASLQEMGIAAAPRPTPTPAPTPVDSAAVPRPQARAAAPEHVSLAAGGARILRVLSSDSLPIPYASVMINGADPRITDANGELPITTGSATTFQAQIRRIGYKPYGGPLVFPDTQRVVTITLPGIAQTLGAVTITGHAAKTPLEQTGFYDRWMMRQKGALSAVFIGPEEIEFRHPDKITNLLYGLNGVHLDHNCIVKNGVKACSMNVYAFSSHAGSTPTGGCPMAIVLDGIQQEPIPPIDQIVNASDVAAIEVYDRGGNMPLSLQVDDTKCGVIAIWTGSRR